MERIPTEIFCTIFGLSITQDPHRDDNSEDSVDETDISEGRMWPSVFDFRKGPWSISRVCRKWRMICTCLPKLWSCFTFSANDLDLNRDGKAALNAWLSFSGTSKLSILIEPDGICNVSHRIKLFEILAGHAERWERIELVNSTPNFWFMLSFKSRLHSLKRVTFLSGCTSFDPDAVSSDSSHYRVFLDAPQFHTLINRDDFPLYKLPMPWSQLTEYEGSARAHVADHFRVLRLTPNLVKCRLEIADADHSDESSFSSPLLLPKLQRLQIQTPSFAEGLQQLSSFIQLMKLPALQMLSIVSEHHTRVFPPFHAFAEVLRGSPCEVRQLELVLACQPDFQPRLQPEHILDLLKATPRLHHLCITVGTTQGSRVLQDTILPRLLVGRGLEGALLPMLNTLELKFPVPSAVHMLDLSTLAAGIRSRWASIGSEAIRNLVITIELSEGWIGDDSDMVSSACWPPIMEVLQEEGLNIVVHTTRNTCLF
ncbi:hypothetical protein E1B28_006708 [Marasmius oreades]|uniref:F-box domain-containing protein n=1 Tax=Marasmius oreades TaxID=181124 RepID=A0A9P8A9U4_9AGAR|nr:uncharacterized protein E1B28_006708 [Marasmius oreades]KAG7096026.1 hypothetical protein E1B28_006708 [Marasmius oreades]